VTPGRTQGIGHANPDPDLWLPAYIALGSNIESPLEQIQRGLEHLSRLRSTLMIAHSGVYRSAPLGGVEQPEFINAVAGVLTQLTPLELLRALKQLEQSLGRQQPVVRWGPRRIDFDLLVYAHAQIESAELTIPHPGITERNFVLYPLLDIAPDLLVPGKGKVRTLAACVSVEGLRRIA
jgi:2-amino-4-hydroxy-6-hydroxymethyldihydropteridine diphosphokinase